MAALSIFMVKFAAIGLSKELAGHYNTAYGYLQIFGILADFGLYAVAVREVSRAPARGERGKPSRADVLGVLITLRLLILACSLSAALLIAWLVPHWRGTPLPMGITIAAFVPAFTLSAGILRTVFQVKHRMQYVFMAEVLQRMITVTLAGAIILAGARGSQDERVYGLFLAVGAVGALELLLTSIFFTRRLLPARPDSWGGPVRPRWDAALLRHYALQAAPYGAAFLFTALYRQMDVTLISALRPQDFQIQNAYYGFVQRMVDMAYLLPTLLLNSALPSLSFRSERGEDTRSLLGKLLLALLLLGSTTALVSALWPRALIALLTTNAYLGTPAQPGSDTALLLLAAPMFLNALVAFSFYVLLTRHRWKPLVLTLGIGVALSLSLNIFLIPRLGFPGAALTAIATHVFLVVALLPQSLRTMPARFGWKETGQWLLYTAGLAAVLFLLRPFLLTSWHTLLLGAGTGVWIGGLLWGTGVVRILPFPLASRKKNK